MNKELGRTEKNTTHRPCCCMSSKHCFDTVSIVTYECCGNIMVVLTGSV